VCGPNTAPPQHQPERPLRVRRAEQCRQRSPVVVADDERPLGSHSVEDRAEIVEPRLHRRDHRQAVGQTHAALVEQDHARPRAQLADEALERRQLPEDLDVRNERVHEDDIDRAVADDLVGDVDVVVGDGVASLRAVHVRILAVVDPSRQTVPPPESRRVAWPGGSSVRRDTGPSSFSADRARA
jgi:hypothetical protein